LRRADKSTWNLYAALAHLSEMNDAIAQATPNETAQTSTPLPLLMLGAIGVVYGDIGTSPLYAMKETFIGPHPLAVDRLHIFGVLSLVFWSLMLIVTVKYVFVAMRADNKGEGGSFALLALISRHLDDPRKRAALVVLGVAAAALFCGDAMLTPAISVLSAVEGLTIVESRLEPLVVPLAALILVGLFLIQSRGTARIGTVFGPIVLVYFASLAVLGVVNIAAHPVVLGVIDPRWAVRFFAYDPRLSFLAMGSVFLAVTGAETLYSDMGHFGRKAIGLSWLTLVYPCLMLNYMGQGALLLTNPAAVENPFYLMAPEWARLPLVGISTAATIIASQAVISGAFSVTHQAIQLGFLPRLKTLHTSERAAGQIYIPAINWGLMVMVLVLIGSFGESTRLASAYGISVVGTMLITTAMLAFLLFQVWRWNRIGAGALIGLFLLVDGVFFASNIAKIADGGWVPLAIAGVTFTLLTSWAKGRQLMRQKMSVDAVPLEIFIRSTANSVHRIGGTSVFLSAASEGVPAALLHNLKHNQVIHERVLVLTVQVEEIPVVAPATRLQATDLGNGFYRVILHYGFMDEVDIPRDLAAIESTCGAPLDIMRTSFFLGRQKLIAAKDVAGMALWREHLFVWMMKMSESAMDFFKLPTNRVVELGSQLRI
jgi:KUP system potassium uptake protein